jgi:hypothetical protein
VKLASPLVRKESRSEILFRFATALQAESEAHFTFAVATI